MKLNYRQTFFIGLAFLSICAFWHVYDNIIPLMLQNTFGLKETVTGTIMALDNVLALFMLPILGAWSDRINTPLGKRTPFILVGTLLAVIFLIFIPIADNNQNFIIFFLCLGCVLIAMGIYRSPAVALMPDLTPKPLRSKANAVINLMGAVGGIYALVMIKLLVKKGDKLSYFPVFLSIAVIMVIAVIILLLTVKEKKLSDQLKVLEDRSSTIVEETGIEKSVEENNDHVISQESSKDVKRSLYLLLASIFLWFTAYNAVSTAFSRYAKVVLGLEGGSFADFLMVATIVAILSYLPIGMISSHLGRKKVILFGVILMTISYGAGFYFTSYSNYLYLVFIFTGIGWAAINVNSYPMVVEMAKGNDIGKYTGLYYTFSMVAQILTPILSGILIENISYRTLFPYAMIFSFLSLCTMIGVKHGDSKPIKKKDLLEHFDIDD